MKRSILFDLDGTLLDTLEDLADSVNAVLTADGFAPHPLEAYKTFIGNGAELLIRRALPAQSDDETVRRMLKAFSTHYAQNYAHKTHPYEGVVEALQHLHGKGIGLAILSNKPHAFTRELAERFFPGLFAAVLGNCPDFPRKPSPAAACWLAGRLDTVPSACLFVGDSGVDMQTGLNAGMRPCGVSWGFREAAELKENGALWVLSSPAELTSLAEL